MAPERWVTKELIAQLIGGKHHSTVSSANARQRGLPLMVDQSGVAAQAGSHDHTRDPRIMDGASLHRPGVILQHPLQRIAPPSRRRAAPGVVRGFLRVPHPVAKSRTCQGNWWPAVGSPLAKQPDAARQGQPSFRGDMTKAVQHQLLHHAAGMNAQSDRCD